LGIFQASSAWWNAAILKLNSLLTRIIISKS
jgi:hypothetical protein